MFSIYFAFVAPFNPNSKLIQKAMRDTLGRRRPVSRIVDNGAAASARWTRRSHSGSRKKIYDNKRSDRLLLPGFPSKSLGFFFCRIFIIHTWMLQMIIHIYTLHKGREHGLRSTLFCFVTIFIVQVLRFFLFSSSCLEARASSFYHRQFFMLEK